MVGHQALGPRGLKGRGSRGMTRTATPTLTSLAPTRACGGDTTDADLVDALRAGDDRAFEALYERYHRRVAAYVYGMVRDHGRAEDISQDVFISALRRMRETDRPIAFKPWVYEIAKNACIDHFRRSQRGEEVSYDAGIAAGEPSLEYGKALACARTPDVVVDDKLALDNLCGAFGGLSDVHHQILVMRELEGQSYREIGEQLGMSRPAVESTLFRARRRLAEEYQELISGERCVRVQGIIAGAREMTLGARDKRRLAAHVSHCQPCRRSAHAAGLEVGTRVAARARVAALLPLPAFLRRRDTTELPAGAPSTGHGSTVAQWSGQLSASMDPALAGWIKVAAAAATVAVVGLGAGRGTDRPDPSVAVGRGGAVPGKSAPAAAVRPPAARPVAQLASLRPAAITPASGVRRGGRDGAAISLTRPVRHGARLPAFTGTGTVASTGVSPVLSTSAPVLPVVVPDPARQILQPLTRPQLAPTGATAAAPVTAAAVNQAGDAAAGLAETVDGVTTSATTVVKGLSDIVAGG